MNIDRVPNPGEGWRHFKGALYRIVSIAPHWESGVPVVIYQPYDPPSGEPMPFYLRPLADFLADVKVAEASFSGPVRYAPRFRFDRDADG